MKTQSTYTYLELFEQIDKLFSAKKTKKENEHAELMHKAIMPLRELTLRIGCNENQSLLLATIFILSLKNKDITANDLIDYLGCSSFDLLKKEEDLRKLSEYKLIYRDRSEFNNAEKYGIPFWVKNNFVGNKEFSPLKENKNSTEFSDLYDSINYLFYEKKDRFINIKEFYAELNALYTRFPNLELIKQAKELELIDEDLVVYFAAALDTVEDRTTDLNNLANHIFKTIEHKLKFRNKFYKETSILFYKNIIELDNSYFIEGRYIKYTQWFRDKALGEFCEEQVQKNYTPTICSLIKPELTHEKKLHYNRNLNETIGKLKSTIENERFTQLQDHLKSNGFNTGITAMLHGYPGTGKTETVKQLAKETGREIYLVDISTIKDKYVGESEKRLKRIFDEYRKAVKINKTYPILLFNESDALISKRIDVAHSTDQMNNAMQNILLEEMENFDGIFMATTNLLMNLDKAFERRFLFKLHFEKPNTEARLAIWKEKLKKWPNLNLEQIAERYDFSGGQIDNVTKKLILDSVLFDTEISEEIINLHCEQETFTTSAEKIGFK